jgi:hypothetical protein
MIMDNIQERVSTAALAGASFQIRGTGETDYKAQDNRQFAYDESIPVELISPTYISFFSTIGYLPPNTMLKVKYRRSPPAFYTLANGDSATKDYRFDIDQMYLRVPTVRVMPQIAPHLDQLRMSVNPRLHFDDFVVKKMPISADSQTRTFNTLFTGNLPKLMFVSFFDEDNFVGKNNLDPFFTSREQVKNLSVTVNGYNIRSFELDMPSSLYSDAYKSFVDAVGASSSTFSITYSAWEMGNSFFAFDFLNCETVGPDCSDETLLQGSMDVAVTFNAKTTKPQVMLVLALTTDSIELLKDGTAVLNRIVV